jgi:hypothetical protein
MEKREVVRELADISVLVFRFFEKIKKQNL